MTNILTRTMDLVHEYNPDTHVHTFSYDTTYPVKVSGNIIKTFNATADFHHGDMFLVDNGSGHFTTIPFEKIYGFRQQLNVEEYFTVGEPVMVIFTLTDDDTDGCATICSLAPVEDTSNQGLFIQYKCNGIDDSCKIKDALYTLYNAKSGDDIEVLGAHIHAGYARDVVIEVTGAFKLNDDSITYHDDEDHDRTRYFSYINIAPEDADPYFTVHMDFSKAVIKTDNIRNTIMSAASRVDGVGDTKSGYHAYLFEFDSAKSTPKFYLDNLRLDNQFLGLFASNIQKPDPPEEDNSSGVDLTTINMAYAKFSNIHYVDTSNTAAYNPIFSMTMPAPIFLDNITSNATIEMDTIDLVDISTDRWHLIANSGTCNIKNLTMYYGMSGISPTYKMHHIAGTLDSLICNVPECFNTNDPRRFTSNISDTVLGNRAISYDRRKLNTAQDFGYVFEEISFDDIENIPSMTITDSEMHVVNHNTISNIGGSLTIKGTTIEHTPVHFETDVCYQNSAIMTYSGVLDIQTSNIILFSKKHGLYGVHAMPLMEVFPYSGNPRPEYRAANINCANTRFLFDHGNGSTSVYSNSIAIDETAGGWETCDIYPHIPKQISLAFAIEQYMPSDFAALIDPTDLTIWRRPYHGYYSSVGVINIIGCDFSADYHNIPLYDSSYCESLAKHAIGLPQSNAIMYGKGKIYAKVAECTCGMNGRRSVSPFSNCPRYGFYMLYNSSDGGLDITNSSITTCGYSVIHLPALDDRHVAKVVDHMKAGDYNFDPSVADFNLDGLVDSNDIVPGKKWLYYREAPPLNISNSTIDNGYTSFNDDCDESLSAHPFWPKLKNAFHLFTVSIPSIVAEKVSTSSYSGNTFGGTAVIISPCGSSAHLSFSNCTFNASYVSAGMLASKVGGTNDSHEITSVQSFIQEAPPLGHFEASDASVTMESCSFMKHNAVCTTYKVSRMTPFESVIGHESNKIYTFDDKDVLVFTREWLYLSPMMPNSSYTSMFSDNYYGAKMYNISNVVINACNFVCDGNAIEYTNDSTMSFANDSRDSSTSGVKWDVKTPSGASLTITNSTLKTITDHGNSTGVNGTVVLSGTCFDADIRNNLMLTGGRCSRTSSNLAYSAGVLNMSDHFNEPSIHSSITFRDNTCCCVCWDIHPGINVTTGYTKQEFLDLMNDNDYRERGDDMCRASIYTSNIIIFGSYVDLDISNNKFLKTRGTIGSRTVTSKSIPYGTPVTEYETTVIENGILTEDISTLRSLISGRTILLGFHTLESNSDSYEQYRVFYCKGKIENNMMGCIDGDMLVGISHEIGSAAQTGLDDDDLHSAEDDIIIHPSTPSTDHGIKEVDITCSGNYLDTNLHSWNELSNGYRVDIDNMQFYK